LAVIGFLLFSFTVADAYELLYGPTGLIRYNKEKAYDGYTLFAPMLSTTTYLIDMEGNVVHKWKSKYPPGLYAMLLPNGHLMRTARPDPDKVPVKFGGVAGLIQEIDWDGNVVWEYKEFTPTMIQHHCFNIMPNGNVLFVGFEFKSATEAIKKGRDPKTMPEEFEWEGESSSNIISGTHTKNKAKGIWPDYVKEVNREGKVVWEWHAWDHIGTGPKELNINYQLPKATEYLHVPDWTHFNTVDYIPETDQILVNSRNFSEFFLINHKTGEIEYRWGNPTTHGEGKKPGFVDDGSQILFGPHHVTRLPNGNFQIFDNGWKRPEKSRSRVVEMDPKTGKIVWQFGPVIGNSFYTAYQGAAQRLPNNNILVTSTNHGHVFEITYGPKPEVVWEWVSPVFIKDRIKCFYDDAKDSVSAFEELGANMIHRAYRYDKDYPGLAGRDLSKKEPLAPTCGEVWKMPR
jgi:hypothetical protein